MSMPYGFLLCLCLQLAWVHSNLDASEPIVRVSPAEDQDDFGYTVVLHQVLEPVAGDFDSSLDSTRLIVGAPRGTYPGGLSGLPQLNPEQRTGLVYQCPVRAGDCDGLLSDSGDERNNDRRLFDGDPNGMAGEFNDPEVKSDQLMGSVLASNGNLFMACAPRWVVDPPISSDLDNRRPVGRCFVSSRSLQNFSAIMPCNGRNTPNPSLIGFNSHCYTGFSASIFSGNTQDIAVVSLLGDAAFNGNLYQYDPNMDTPSLISMTTNADNENFVQTTYEGYATTVGYITNTDNQDVISGVPRFDGNTLTGGVRVRTQSDFSGDPAVPTIEGFQTGEYFGYAIAAADLNNDGYDELIVGAPIFSTNSSQELGIVYVYENIGGDLNRTNYISLTGSSTPLARFGTSIVNLGDVNGDNYEDIAVGAPYEVNSLSSSNSGAVYIYYGASTEMGLISRSPDQVIFAQSIVDTVSDVFILRTFGFSLASGVDVDGNLYNDLLIGAYESKTITLIRSFSVASVSVNVSTNVDTVTVDTEGSMVILTVCASYSGRGLDGRSLETSIKITEDISSSSSQPSRLYFQSDLSQISLITKFVFNSTDRPTCVDVDIFVRSVEQLVSGEIDLLTPLQVKVDFLPVTRPAPSFNAGDQVTLIDYRTIPVLIIEGNTTVSIIPTVNCSLDEDMQEICMPDLTVTLLNLTYKDSLNRPIPGKEAIAGSVETVHIDLSFDNIGQDPAFGAEIVFTLPDRFGFVQAVVPSLSPTTSCQKVGDTSGYICGLPKYIPSANEVNRLTLIWRLTESIIGNEADDVGLISIQLISSRDRETNITNNELINGPIRIRYSAVANLDISHFVFEPATSVTYRGIPPESIVPTVDELGTTVNLTLTTVNRGPSSTPNAILDIFIPTSDMDNSYYLYLFNVTTGEVSGGGSITCDTEAVNPQGLSSSPIRAKRFTNIAKQTSESDEVSTTRDVVRDCSTVAGRSDYCSHIRCNIKNFPGSVSVPVTISAALDERFFQFQTSDFVFVGYASIINSDSFVQDDNLTNNQRSTRSYRVTLFMEPDNSSFPIWIPILCGIVAVIIIVALFVLLYFVGFFRRKKRSHEKDIDAECDFVPPAPSKPTPSEEPLDLSVEDTDDGDIGETDDVQDGAIGKPQVDPEETSL